MFVHSTTASCIGLPATGIAYRYSMPVVARECVEDFRTRAAKLVLDMDAHRPWFIKEPRLCLLLPLWRQWLEVPVCIHIHRHPIEVASSLLTRNGIPIKVGIALWERYVRAALAASAGLPQVVVAHRQLMQAPVEAISQLFEDLTRQGVQGLHVPSEREIRAFVRGDLYRERDSRDDLRTYSALPQLELFKALQSGRPVPGPGMEDEGASVLAEYEAGLPPLEPPTMEKKVSETIEVVLRKELASREQEIKTARDISRKFEQATEALQNRLAQLEEKLSQEILGKQAAISERCELDRQVLALQAKLQAVEGSLVEAKHEALAAISQLNRLKEAKSNAVRTAELRLRDLSRLTRLLLQQDGQLAALKQENRTLATDRAGAEQLWAAAENARQTGEAEAAELRRQLVEIRQSVTWRMGAPLRLVIRVAKRYLGRGPLSDADLLKRSEWFDAKWYLSRYPDVAENGADPVEHYLSFGGMEGRNPGPRFSTKRYLEANADVAESGANALVHYLRYGQREGRKPC